MPTQAKPSPERAREILRHLTLGAKTADEIAVIENTPHTYSIAPALTALRQLGLLQWSKNQHGKRIMRNTRRGSPAGVTEITTIGRVFLFDRSKSL